ncbi:G-type lectin S-receptor-like serine/threonine-protein kinase SD2-5 [Rhodamnia argentea]|uniref:Receptor-like serine/threonine-protein kinase n=1 Tax=Rhodamnia argentea TaxID=178133 RepID=A0ABM3HN66_9MYRT|nr:G-type lectin S-receptor-like serine/threonine-protein kinase SD2-5 [Rhodamnia argentea]
MLTHRSSSPATLCLSLLGLYFLGLVLSQPTANLSTTWAASSISSVSFGNGSPVGSVKPILLRGNDVPSFACGFVSMLSETSYLFAISIVYTNASQIDQTYTAFPEVVWAANRNNPMVNPTLELTSEGDLILKDGDGPVAWSTNTSGKSVVGLNLTDSGNLVLFDDNNVPVWQSFDHPMDSLVLGQKLTIGQKLVPSVSETNWTAQSLLSLSMTSTGLFAQMDTNPPQVYYPVRINFPNTSNDSNYIEFVNGTLALFTNSTRNGSVFINIPSASLFMRLEYDGHLRAYEFDTAKYQWTVAADILVRDYGDCGYPTVCGQYGICTSNGQCTCPDSNGGTNYFKQTNDRHPNLGCYEEVPLSCDNLQFQSLLELGDLSYFTYSTDPQSTPDLANVTKVNCKDACAKNCSCKAAFYVRGSNIRSDAGSCYLLSEVFSLMNLEQLNNSIGYIKVQNSSNKGGKTNRLGLILGSSLGSLFALIIVIGVIKVSSRKREVVDEADEDHLDQVPGMVMRFTYDSLKVITEDFSKKLGEGGFGSVFEGILKDGSKVAVKRLDGLGHIKKSFLAEVETIGSIHHVNLVTLVGFCTESSHRLLVYEYMPNGSLDKWIFCISSEYALNWQQRRKIIYDIAKGLNYLHEECRRKILHLDIKPQNILLDENFNAKVADFGLSKLIDRDKSQVMTTMRGTPGYLAPEWLSAAITEKVDVYSFGVVVLEIVSARKLFDNSQDSENTYLVGVFRRKAEEGGLSDFIDSHSEDMRLNEAQAVNMLRIAAWCLQGDSTKRPSMSTIVKVLDGLMDVPDDLEYDFSYPPLMKTSAKAPQEEVPYAASTPLLPSVLSGPR